MKKTEPTVWEIWTYDVWGNRKDGYEVNDRSCICRDYLINCKIEVNNFGTPFEFQSCSPSDRQIKRVLGIKPRVKIERDGDDIVIYVNAGRDEYPIGELCCTSHESLSPIMVKHEG